MKRTIISIITIALIATLSAGCLTACSEKEGKKSSETTAATDVATTAPTSSASSQPSVQSTTAAPADTAQSETASPEQESYMKQQKAIQKAVESAEQLYGQGEWGVASFEKQTSDTGTEMYYIGLVDYSNSQSPTYYFYVDGENCSPDNSANAQAAAPEGQEEQGNKHKAAYNAVSKAEELYGEGNWGVSSFEQQTSSDGSTVYYIGVTNYADSQASVYYFYADADTCTPAE